MPRFLFLIDDDSYFCWHRLDLARAVKQEGYEVLVATHVQDHGRQIEDEGFRLFPIRFRRGIQSLTHEFATLVELIRLYRAERPDIVHHISLKHVLYGSIAARVTGVPVVVNAFTGLGSVFMGRTTKAKVLRTVITRLLRWSLRHPCSRVTFENDDDRRDMVRARVVPEDRAIVIHGVGVNTEEYIPNGQPDEIPLVVMVSRMLWDKGVKEFVEAGGLLRKAGANLHCVLVGAVDPESPSAIDLETLRQWEREGVVEWWGHRRDMMEIYGRAWVVVLPTFYGEGLPRVLLEAASCGKPLVATQSRGCTDIVQQGKNGFLVPPKDAQSLADAVLALVKDPSLCRRMGVKGREFVLERFSSKIIVEQTLAIYHALKKASMQPVEDPVPILQ